MRDRLFIAAFAALLGVVMAGYVYSYVSEGSFSEIEFGLAKVEPAGTLPAIEKAVKDKRLDAYVRGAYQAKIQNYMRREFLYFDRTLLGYSTAVTAANLAFYTVALPSHPVVPLGVDSGNMFLDRDANALVGITLGNTRLLEDGKRNAADAAELVRRYPGIDFNYYGVTAWTMTRPAIQAGYADPSRIAWERFERDVDGVVDAVALDVDGWDRLFFRTDHHWNPQGAYRGYLDSMEMLAADDPAIGEERLPFEERVVDGVVYRGASARKAAYEPITEDFRVLVTRDPDVHAYRNGRRVDRLIINEAYLEDPPTEPFADQYASFHGHGMGLHEYRNDAKPGTGNLLMFGDSFSRGMDDLVASHYDRTFVVDLRSYEQQQGERFDFDAFVKEHDINAVLCVGRPVRVMSTATALIEGTGVK